MFDAQSETFIAPHLSAPPYPPRFSLQPETFIAKKTQLNKSWLSPGTVQRLRVESVAKFVSAASFESVTRQSELARAAECARWRRRRCCDDVGKYARHA